MSLKEVLTSLKDELNNQNNYTKNNKVYRLRYIKFHNSEYFYKPKQYDIIDIPFDMFIMPNNLLQTEGYKILSYLMDIIEKNNNIKKRNINSVEILNNMIKQKNSIFKLINKNRNENEITDLFVIIGKIENLKNTNYNSKYFEWYIPNVSEDDINKICKKNNLNIKDMINETEKQLIKKK